MKLETLQKRIEGKEKEIVKLEKKLERIEKAEATNWEVNPYYYSEYDKRYTQRDLDEARKALEDYKNQMVVEIEKANSRNIQAIVEFLNMWKERTETYYKKHVTDWIETLKKYYEEDSKYCKWFNSHFEERHNKELLKEMKKPREEANAIHAMYNYLNRYMERKNCTWVFDVDLLRKDLEEEANRKYDFIIERTNSLIGEIKDASNLSVGDKGDLNGFIKGAKGTVKVETIGAGGYNIQCFHFRTLINKIA